MKFCRFVPKSGGVASRVLPSYGLIEGEIIHGITAPPWLAWKREEASLPMREARLLAPVEPSKIVCVGRNYAAHAAELGNQVPKEPMIFLKTPSSVIGTDEAIVLTRYSNHVDYEAELAVIIGKTCSQLGDEDDPLSYVLGYSCLNDVSARDLQKSDVQFTRAKGFDTFCPVGPHIETQLDPRNVLVEARVNGVVKQSGSTSLMVYPVEFLIRWLSRMMTLIPGDVIATGTPAGVGPLTAGDTVDVSVSGIGVLHNPVHAPAS
ncbi:MAG TPA: fumarylacetoacetate hydrolase family protein [Candidatus Acidoferrum sp.]|nr:fumarylacetoacetate hydrolase family protein [Candidatus Acidoferrum sp.]